jgi:hypothetical protein
VIIHNIDARAADVVKLSTFVVKESRRVYYQFVRGKWLQAETIPLQHNRKGHSFGSATPCASPPPRPSIIPIILFLSTTLLTRMTGISLHMQWPLTSKSHGSFPKERDQGTLSNINSCWLKWSMNTEWPPLNRHPVDWPSSRGRFVNLHFACNPDL